jgi:uncharacterized OB-fold protein
MLRGQSPDSPVGPWRRRKTFLGTPKGGLWGEICLNRPGGVICGELILPTRDICPECRGPTAPRPENLPTVRGEREF